MNDDAKKAEKQQIMPRPDRLSCNGCGAWYEIEPPIGKTSAPDPAKAGTTAHRIDKRHPEDCNCEGCKAYANIPYVDLTIRVLCEDCHSFTLLTDRLYGGIGTQWSPSLYCGRCKKFIEIIEVLVGDIGVRKSQEPAPQPPPRDVQGEGIADAERLELVVQHFAGIADYLEHQGQNVSANLIRKHSYYVASALQGAWKERDELRAIVDQLPKTVDGVPFAPGSTVYWPHPDTGQAVAYKCDDFFIARSRSFDSIDSNRASRMCYSTPLLAAKDAAK